MVPIPWPRTVNIEVYIYKTLTKRETKKKKKTGRRDIKRERTTGEGFGF